MPHGTAYTKALAEEICQRLADGETLKAICRDKHMPSDAAVRQWALADKEGFAERYRVAREIGYHGLADEILEISDDGRNDWMRSQDPENPGYKANGEVIQRSRLRVDTRKWLLAKALPRVYGEKIEHTGKDGGPLVVEVVKFGAAGQAPE